MKKILAFILCVTLLLPVGIGINVSAEDTQPTTCDAYLTDAVVQIDGVKESAWKNAPSFTLDNIRKNYLSDGDLIVSEGLAEVTVSLMWDDTRIASANRSLYVLVEVKDSTPYTSASSAQENDSFEMWISVKGVTWKLMIERDGSTSMGLPKWPWQEAASTNGADGWTAEYRVELNYPQDSDSSSASRPDWSGSTMYVDFVYNDATATKGGRVACIGWCDNANTTAEDATTGDMGICNLSTMVAKGVVDYASGLPDLTEMTAETFANATAYAVVHYTNNSVVAKVYYTPLWDGTNLYVLAELKSDTTPCWENGSAWLRDSFWVNLTVNGSDAKLRVDRGGNISGWAATTWPRTPDKTLSSGTDGFSNIYKIALNYNEISGDDTSKPSVKGTIKMKFNYLNATNNTGACTTVGSKGTEYELAQPGTQEPPVTPADTTVNYVGYQVTAATDKTDDGVDNKTYDLRLVAVLNDGDYQNYEYLGFDVEIVIDGVSIPNKQDIQTVYSSIIAKEGSGYAEYTAEQLGGEYIFALNCNNIPLVGDAIFTVTPYYKLIGADGEVPGTTYTFTVEVSDFN